MQIYEYGNPNAEMFLLQPVDNHDLELIEKEYASIREHIPEDFQLIAVRVDNWNSDLSPWEAPPVFGKEGFGGNAAATLTQVLKICSDRSKAYYLGGYSLAGLFALWAAYQTSLFRGIAAASPSVWFPGFTDYIKSHEIHTHAVYLSLGDREDKTRNPVMAAVSDRIREAHTLLNTQGVTSTLEWNRGNHFMDADLRTAKAFTWVVKQCSRSVC